MSKLQETTVIHGYSITFNYDRECPYYTVHKAFYATNKREVELSLNSIWSSRQYKILTHYYNYKCNKRIQRYIWLDSIWKYRKTPRNNLHLTFLNNYGLMRRFLFFIKAILIYK